MRRVNPILLILLVLLVFLIQVSFLKGLQGLWSKLNLFLFLIVWFSYLSSPYRFLICLLAGFLMDLLTGNFGLYLISYLVVSQLVLVLKNYLATTGRSLQFLIIVLVSFLVMVFLPILLSWFYFKFLVQGNLFSVGSLDQVVFWQNLLKQLVVNLFVSWLLFKFFIKRLKLFR